MSTLRTYDDFLRLGFDGFLRSEQGMGEVRQFVRSQLDEALRDPDRHFPFAGLLANYLRGRDLEDVPPDLRQRVTRESLDAYWRLLPDLKRLTLVARDEDALLAVLRGLFTGLPAAVLGQSMPSLDRRILEMIDVHLIAYKILSGAPDHPAPVVRLVARGLYRWRAGHLAELLLGDTELGPFLQSLRDDERRPFPEVERLEEKLHDRLESPGPLLYSILTTDPEEASLQGKRWSGIRERLSAREGELLKVLEKRVERLDVGNAVSSSDAALLWALARAPFE